MKSFTVLRNFTSIALIALCVTGVSSANARRIYSTYILTDLGVLPGQKDNSSTPAALNNQAQVAGTSGTAAFRYTKESKVPMEDVGKDSINSITRGFGINGSGQVVGDATFGKNQTSRAAIFSNGSAVDLGTMEGAGAFSRANGINATSQVVGFVSDERDGQNSRAFIVSAANRFSHMIDLGTLGGASAQACGINDSGFVTGNAQTLVSPSVSQVSHAFIWSAEAGMLDLGTLAGDFSYGTSINANNHVTGYSTIDQNNDRTHAFLFNGNEMIDLGSLSGAALDMDYSYALGVNIKDQVVGYTYFPSNEGTDSINAPFGPNSVAFVYSNGLMENLNDLVGVAAQKYRLERATAINDKGEVVAIAYDNDAQAYHAVLLTPNPVIGIPR